MFGCTGADQSLLGSTDVELAFTRCDCSNVGWQDDVAEQTWADCRAENTARVDVLLNALGLGQTVTFSTPIGLEGDVLTWAIDPNGPDEYYAPQCDESGGCPSDGPQLVEVSLSSVDTFVSNCSGSSEQVSTLVVSWSGESRRIPF